MTDSGHDQSKRMNPARRSSRLRTFMAAIIAVSLLAIIGSLAIEARRRALQMEMANNFKQVGIALQSCDVVNGHLPRPYEQPWDKDFGHYTDEIPLFSWRYSIMPVVISVDPEYSWDERWRTVPQPYAYSGWGGGAGDQRRPESVPNITCIFAITGPGTAFGDGEHEPPRSLKDLDPDTILCVEIGNSELHWMEPGDFDIRTMPRTINDPNSRGISSRDGDGFHVLFADGEAWHLGNDVPFDELQKFFTVDGAKQFDRDVILGPYR